MLNEDLHQFVLNSEAKIQSLEENFNEINKAQHEWTMWLTKEHFPEQSQGSLSLHKISSDADWEEMFRIRCLIEKEFGVEDPSLVRRFVEDIKNKTKKLNAHWFLAKVKNKVIGEIGIVVLEESNFKVGRLQDVDIIPSEQKKGYGNQLLIAISNFAHKEGLDALCLMAKADDWPKDWYLRFGFQKIGESF